MPLEMAPYDSVPGIELGGDLPDAPPFLVKKDGVVDPFRLAGTLAFSRNSGEL